MKFSRTRQLTLSEHLSNNDSVTQHGQRYSSALCPDLYVGPIVWLYIKDSDSPRMQSIRKQHKRELWPLRACQHGEAIVKHRRVWVWSTMAQAVVEADSLRWSKLTQGHLSGWFLHGELEFNVYITTALKLSFENVSYSISAAVRVTCATEQNQEELPLECRRGCQTQLRLFAEAIILPVVQRLVMTHTASSLQPGGWIWLRLFTVRLWPIDNYSMAVKNTLAVSIQLLTEL